MQHSFGQPIVKVVSNGAFAGTIMASFSTAKILRRASAPDMVTGRT